MGKVTLGKDGFIGPEAPALLRALIEQGVDIDEARWVGADLESVFMSETAAPAAQPIQEAAHAG
ncbi:hypothetical protein D3C77_445840 [compost metagenome]